MNDLFFLIPIAVLIIVLIPALMEIFRRKDLGPRIIPESTIFVTRDHLNSIRALGTSADPSPYKERSDVVLPLGTDWSGDLVAHGDLRLGDNCHIHGTLKASGETKIGDFSVIEGNVLSKGRIRVGQYCEIMGVIM